MLLGGWLGIPPVVLVSAVVWGCCLTEARLHLEVK